ncbi:hypothetical protein [Roseateles sp.]|jgi:hypothetical protein|uniref:hypothetical protein n=1 Tax=Roseateles sp. TaxID=1971397 RepID=UPI0037C8203D
MPAPLTFALRYFALVFATGFVLGTVRVLLVVPRLGERWAELLEMPLMGLAIWCWARWLLRRQVLSRLQALAAGGVALALLVGAELTLAVLLQERSLQDYIASRDPVSGTAYLLMLLLFALMPVLLCHHARADDQAGG